MKSNKIKKTFKSYIDLHDIPLPNMAIEDTCEKCGTLIKFNLKGRYIISVNDGDNYKYSFKCQHCNAWYEGNLKFIEAAITVEFDPDSVKLDHYNQGDKEKQKVEI